MKVFDRAAEHLLYARRVITTRVGTIILQQDLTSHRSITSRPPESSLDYQYISRVVIALQASLQSHQATVVAVRS